MFKLYTPHRSQTGKGLKLNIGKKGLGLSAGVKGLRVGIGSKGAYTSTGIPGTGLYSINYIGKSSKSSNGIVPNSNGSLKKYIFLLLVFVGFVLLFSFSVAGFSLLIIGGIIYYFQSKQPKQMAIRKLAKARKFFNQQNYEETITLLKEVIQLDKKNYDAMRLLGGALHNTEKYDEAIECLKTVLAMNPTDTDTCYNLGLIYEESGDKNNALKYFKKIYAENANYRDVA